MNDNIKIIPVSINQIDYDALVKSNLDAVLIEGVKYIKQSKVAEWIDLYKDKCKILEGMLAWKPIDQAPKDGTEILIRRKSGKICIAKYVEYTDFSDSSNLGNFEYWVEVSGGQNLFTPVTESYIELPDLIEFIYIPK